jgi:hypothetical protein
MYLSLRYYGDCILTHFAKTQMGYEGTRARMDAPPQGGWYLGH